MGRRRLCAKPGAVCPGPCSPESGTSAAVVRSASSGESEAGSNPGYAGHGDAGGGGNFGLWLPVDQGGEYGAVPAVRAEPLGHSPGAGGASLAPGWGVCPRRGCSGRSHRRFILPHRRLRCQVPGGFAVAHSARGSPRPPGGRRINFLSPPPSP
jgi:hypothetical protein